MESIDLIANCQDSENNKNVYINNFINFLQDCINNSEIETNESNSIKNKSDNKQETFIKNLLINKYNFK